MDATAPDPVGIWYLNVNYRGGHNNFFLTATITGDPVSGSYQGELINEHEKVEILDNISWNAGTGLLEFRRNGHGFWDWYRGTVVEGVFAGRFSHSTQSPEKPVDPQTFPKTFRSHVTGWNSAVLDRDIVPRSYDLVINKDRHARLRIDRLPSGQFVGRLKVYAFPFPNDQFFGFEGEEPEYDLEVTQWDGTNLVFARHDPHWSEVYAGTANGRTISGTFTQIGTHHSGSWTGMRSGVLSYGLVTKTVDERAAWQDRTRSALLHLMMADNPAPLMPTRLPPVNPESNPQKENPEGKHRDDNAQEWPQNYHIRELHFQYPLPNPYYALTNPYGNQLIEREFHGYLAIPNTTPPPNGFRAVLALNGHHGSAWQTLDPSNEDIYWYGDAFARRGYVVLAVDISHRPPGDSEPLYDNGGDYVGPKSALHASIKADGFDDSDWTEDGERAWDAMRGLDYLLSQSDVRVDPAAILVTGLSMGGEMSTVVAALDPRLSGCIPAGFSPDLDVILHRANDKTHHCWRWVHADIREYIDTSDLHALIAPRPLIVQTGRQDTTFSSFSPPFAADKQVARRSRVAYGSEVGKFVHYLHFDHHFYHVGDVDHHNQNAERGVHTPTITEPHVPFSLTWQIDAKTSLLRPSLFHLLDTFFDSQPPPPTFINEFPHPRFIMNFDPNPDDEPYGLDVLQGALNQSGHRVSAIELHALYRSADRTVIWAHDQDYESGALPLSDAIDYILQFKGTSPTVYNDHRQFFLVVTPHSKDPRLPDGIYQLLGQYAQHLSTAVNSDQPPRGITVIISGESQTFYEHRSGRSVNRLCIVEGVDYTLLNDIVNRTRQPFQWVLIEHEKERGQVNTYHNLDVDSFNVRVWNADDDPRLAIASGADSVNARSSDLSGTIQQLQDILQSQAPRGTSPSLAEGNSQAVLVWRGADSNNLYVALGSSLLLFSQEINPWGFSRQINLTYLLEDQPLAQAPAVALTPQEELIIVYEGTDAQRLWYITGRFISPDRFITFQGMQHRLTLPGDAGRRGSNPSVAVGPDGRVIVVYEGTDDQRLWYVSGFLHAGVLEGTEFSLSQHDSRRGYTPSIAIDSAGQVIVVYRGTDQEKLWYVSGQVDPHTGEIIGTEFSLTEQNARRGFTPSVAIDANGQVLIAYEGTENQRLWYVSGSRDGTGRINGTEFSLTEHNARRGTHPTVSFSSNGFATILYTGTDAAKLWFVTGTIDQTGRLNGQEQLLNMSLVE
jgi:dienelactone hydrolase